MTPQYFAPQFGKSAYNCPFCGVYARQNWSKGAVYTTFGSQKSYTEVEAFRTTTCTHCSKTALWLFERLVHPVGGGTPPPNPDLDPEIVRDYTEAASIIQFSPRGAAALLRLCVQRLVQQLGLPGKNLNDDIGALVQKGLDPDVQVALDSMRVIGNNAVHPLEMDLRNDTETAASLFSLTNFIAEQMITNRKKLQMLFEKLPERARDAIKRRDG